MPEATRPGGRIRVIVGTDPAAGGDIMEVVPAGVQWRLISARAGLATDVTVINRVVRLICDDGVNSFALLESNYNQPDSLTMSYTFADVSLRGVGLGEAVISGIPAGMILGPGFRFFTSTIGLQAGDNWGAPSFMVEEWPA